jgi:hypothetical protein
MISQPSLNMLAMCLSHCLHARQQLLPIVFPSPISLIRRRFHFHLRHRGLSPSLSRAMDWPECPQIAPFILGEQMAKHKQSCATLCLALEPNPRLLQGSLDSRHNYRVYPFYMWRRPFRSARSLSWPPSASTRSASIKNLDSSRVWGRSSVG